MADFLFEHVTIIGPGLLGASLGLALKSGGLARHVAGVGRKDSPSLAVALQRGAVDTCFTDAAAAARNSDLVVMATALGLFPTIFQQIADSVGSETLITDVGSTKQLVMRWAAELLRPGALFVGSHPMAGSEKRGPEFARADLFLNATCVICAPDDSAADSNSRPATAVAQIETLWQKLGMRTRRMSAEMHDRQVALISHLPHAAAAALVLAALGGNGPAAALAATGFLDTTRVASGDVDVWTDIFQTNRTAVTDALDQFMNKLNELRHAVSHGDDRRVREFLQSASALREALLRTRTGGGAAGTPYGPSAI